VSDKLLDQPETPLEMVRRYIAEGEERCTQLTHRLEQMEAHDPPQATSEVERLLAVLDRGVSFMREHLQQELALQKSGRAGA
jgi:nitrogen-specific signal transduction histidine kinase